MWLRLLVIKCFNEKFKFSDKFFLYDIPRFTCLDDESRFILLIAFIATGLVVFSQSPNKINYQAVVRDNSGSVVANTAVPVSIVISDGTNSYTYAPSPNPSTNGFGLLNLVIGQMGMMVNLL